MGGQGVRARIFGRARFGSSGRYFAGAPRP